MAEKGGKGFPVGRGKTALKTPASKQAVSKGKDNTLPKKVEPVEIESSDSEPEGFMKGKNETSSKTNKRAPKNIPQSGNKTPLESLKTGGKPSFETPATTGDRDKGGKAFNSGKAGGKGSHPQASAKSPLTEVERKLEMDLPMNARVLMDCEAAVILQGIQESLTVISDDPNVKMPESYNKALQYCKASSNYRDTKAARELLEYPCSTSLKMHGVTDGELCMIGNICPESIDEVYALIPSLKANKRKNEEPLREALVSLANYKPAL